MEEQWKWIGADRWVAAAEVRFAFSLLRAEQVRFYVFFLPA
jgi:hypothetical protein